jgi:hypothetical protein
MPGATAAKAGPIDSIVSIDEVLQRCRHVAQLQIAAPAQLDRDVGGNIARPALDGIEGENAYRVFVLALEQVHDHDLEVGCLTVGFAPDPAKPAQVVHHQVDIMVIPTGIIEGVQLDRRTAKPPARTGDSSAAAPIRS